MADSDSDKYLAKRDEEVDRAMRRLTVLEPAEEDVREVKKRLQWMAAKAAAAAAAAAKAREKGLGGQTSGRRRRKSRKSKKKSRRTRRR